MQGWIKLYRKLVESEIMKKPPLYLKVFIWLLLKAQHGDYNGLKRGQGKTSIPEIIEAMSYKVGYRIEKPTKKEVFGIIEWLRNPYEGNNEGNMMVTMKVTHGFVYTIVKYEFYQDKDDNEGNNESLAKVQRRSRQGNNINKNVKNDKNVRSNIFRPPTIEQVKEYCIERNNNVDPEKFIDHYTANGWIRGKTKIKDWKACVRTWEKKGGSYGGTKDNSKQDFKLNPKFFAPGTLPD